jgi:DNA-binding phage protein
VPVGVAAAEQARNRASVAIQYDIEEFIEQQIATDPPSPPSSAAQQEAICAWVADFSSEAELRDAVLARLKADGRGSMTRIAERAGLTRQTMCNWLKGRHGTNDRALAVLRKYVNGGR